MSVAAIPDSDGADLAGGATPHSAGRPSGASLTPDLAAAWMLGLAAFVAAVAILIAADYYAIGTRALLILGGLAAWRYGWGLVHLLRALIYLHIVFPRLKARAWREPHRIPHIYVVVCSFRIPPEQFRRVHRELIANCVAAGVPCTIVSSFTSDRDCRLLAEVIHAAGDPPAVRVIGQFQKGDGKRGAMAAALRTIAAENPDPRSATILIDGDVVLERNAVLESARFLSADPSLSALTINNDARMPSAEKGRDWYQLRFAQRHVLMSSLSLSRRLLVLTGRFSMYRTGVLVDRSSINALAADYIDHWVHGRIHLLSGDDKSLWYQALKRGGGMLYLPHVTAVSFESMPNGLGFVAGSSRLMLRWLGNMVRANGRALALGPRRCGLFLWWCLLDQRFAVFSTLFGVSVSLCLAFGGNIVLLPVYFAWLVVTRTLMSAVYGVIWGRFHPAWPLLLAYNQIWGAMLKLYLMFRPDRQQWSRQNIFGRQSSTVFRRAVANLLFVTALVAVVSIAATAASTF